MQSLKRITVLIFALMLIISGSVVTYAQSNSEALKSIDKKLQQQEKEKESVSKEIEHIRQEIDSLNTYVSENQQAMEDTQKRMKLTSQLIEEKKEEIVTLEDNILSRKDVMKDRLVALQHDSNLNILLKVLIDSKNFNDFIQRATAVTTLFDADKDILDAQQNDLKQIEEDKKEIDRQQSVLEEDQRKLVRQQVELNQNLQKRQETLQSAEVQYKKITSQMTAANQEKAGIEAQIKAAQQTIRHEQKAIQNQSTGTTVQTNPVQAVKGKELYVTATAYSPEESNGITKLGYNIRNNPNLKLIAVDPAVIPLGKKVWVEGYGVAVAGDTGSAIVGHRIDVLMPSKQRAISWGRKTVKVVILE